MRGSRTISLLILIILGLLVLVLTACSTATPSATRQIPSTQPFSGEGTPPLSSALVNACTYHAPEPTPTPTPDLTKRPTSTPFPTPTPEGPSAEVVAYPDLPLPALPASAEAWQDAVVRVSVERASGRTRVQQGLVVSDGAVLTVLDPMEKIASLSVRVSGRGVFTAALERFDVRTGAALLSVGAEGPCHGTRGAPDRSAWGASVAPEPRRGRRRARSRGDLRQPESQRAGPSLRAARRLHTLLPPGHHSRGSRWHTHRSCRPHADILRSVDRSWRA